MIIYSIFKTLEYFVIVYSFFNRTSSLKSKFLSFHSRDSLIFSLLPLALALLASSSTRWSASSAVRWKLPGTSRRWPSRRVCWPPPVFRMVPGLYRLRATLSSSIVKGSADVIGSSRGGVGRFKIAAAESSSCPR